MTHFRATASWLAAALFLLPTVALAARPLTTEDASTREDATCQLEAWVDRTRANGTSVFAAPACAIVGVEFQLGSARARADGKMSTVSEFVQAKHAFQDIDEGAWGAGLVVGMARFPQRETKPGWGDPFVNAILSVGLAEDRETRPVLHLNLGTVRAGDEGRSLTTWGVAIEKPVTERLAALAEAFGENRNRAFLRAGGRYTVFEGLHADLTYVSRAGGSREERLWSIGIHWEPGFMDFRGKPAK